MDRLTWYEALSKPAWTPSPAFIGTMWTILYPLIIVVFGVVVMRVLRGDWPGWVLVPVGLNVVTNLAFTPLLFGLRNLPLASVDVVAVLVTIVWCMAAIWPHSRLWAVALLPYLAWVATASVLQLTITFMNR